MPFRANALVWQDLGSGTSLPSNWDYLNFVAEGRIGNSATNPSSAWSGSTEMSVGRSTSSSMTSGQFAWQDARTYAFELTFNGTQAKWTLDKGGSSQRTVTYSSFYSLSRMDGFLFKLRASPNGGDRITLSDLTLNSVALSGVGAGTVSWNPGSGSSSTHWWGLADAGSLSQGFTLAGKVNMDWRNDSSKPSGSDLAFEIKGVDAPDCDVNPIPEPGTLALLGGGLLGLGGALRRKRRA